MATDINTNSAQKDIGPKGVVAQAGDDVVNFVDERTGIVGVGKWFMFRNIPKGTSWFQTLGFTAMVVFGMQAITGIFLAMHYKPDPATAHASIEAITNEVTWGWLVRGMHKWGASAMVVVVFLHMGRVFIWGAYKYPRELTWLTGACLLMMTLAMGLTGYLLVWDQKAYWATVVAVNVVAQAPIIGPYLGSILRAGPEFGPDTLSRFYAIHMLLIPGAMATFIAIHVALVARLGIAETPWSKRRLAVEAEEDAARRRAARDRIARGRTPVPAGEPAPDPVRVEAES